MGSGMLGLEMPMHHPHHPQHQHPHPHQQQQQQQQQQHPFASHLQQQQQQQHHLVSFGVGGHEADPHNQSQQGVKQNAYAFGNKSKQPPSQQVAISDEDEPGFAAEDGGGADGRKRVSPWQRVKWTDNMVRLLIMVVYYVGDDAGPEGNDLTGGGGNCKKKSGGLLQKKGKWKSVSRAMMEKGFYVSPQQCEDKFNDLNKRYKRVNDIIGKGTACRVVENQNLLESLDHIPPKLKEEVKKLLNSKHLFFREMCAYHNSGGGGGGIAAGGAHQIPDVAVESSQHHQQDRCFHSSQGAAANGNSRARTDSEGLKLARKRGISHEEEEDEDVEDEDDGEEDEEEDDDEDEETEDGGKSRRIQGGDHEDEDDDEKMARKKRQKRGTFPSVSPSVQQLSCELMNVLQDGSKNPWEQRQWMRTRTVQLEEQRVSYQCQAFELEKQRLKWLKFSGKKERELERMKLNNERLRLENDRMVLLLRQKELELVDLHQHQHSSSKPTSMN